MNPLSIDDDNQGGGLKICVVLKNNLIALNQDFFLICCEHQHQFNLIIITFCCCLGTTAYTVGGLGQDEWGSMGGLTPNPQKDTNTIRETVRDFSSPSSESDQFLITSLAPLLFPSSLVRYEGKSPLCALNTHSTEINTGTKFTRCCCRPG